MAETSSNLQQKANDDAIDMMRRRRRNDPISIPHWQAKTSHGNAIGAMTAPIAYELMVAEHRCSAARYEL
jgi:hypothetical protein